MDWVTWHWKKALFTSIGDHYRTVIDWNELDDKQPKKGDEILIKFPNILITNMLRFHLSLFLTWTIEVRPG